MLITIIVLSIALLFSFGYNAVQHWTLRKIRTNPKNQTYDAKELLTDLLRGEGLVRITRIAPGDVFLRSPRT